MKNNFFLKIKKGFFKLQPLTHKPKNQSSQISDLFIWRETLEWQTYFDLIDIPGLFDFASKNTNATLIIFDRSGKMLFNESIKFTSSQVTRVKISDYLKKIKKKDIGKYGTFAIFHSRIPEKVLKTNSYITERGYVSYLFKNSTIRSYVHGNLDAIALNANLKLSFLAGTSFFYRQYKLQHQLQGPGIYEIAIINPTQKTKKFLFETKSLQNKCLTKDYKFIKPGEMFLLPIKLNNKDSVRLIITSRIVMARPLVFKVLDNEMNVFHG